MDSPPQNLSFSDAFALQKSGNFQAAIDSYGAIVATTPGNASAWNNLGNCLRSIGRFEDSAVCLRRALSLNPSRANYRLNLSLTLLSLGDYASAWSEYEARLELIGHGADIRAAAPGWRGEALSASETLLIYGNQGLGDEMQCLRYLPRVLDLAPHVVLEVQAPLRSLANGFSGPA
ncbi:MAG: tetratricopeptide repeat protein, partial [Verrucomicrobiales bacterium]|nr:tetratricopeptide repeat protein [Verrucomicrobiales bacterium]